MREPEIDPRPNRPSRSADGRSDPSAARPGTRRAYRPPRLKEYGRLAELTRFGGSEILDSGSGLGDLA